MRAQLQSFIKGYATGYRSDISRYPSVYIRTRACVVHAAAVTLHGVRAS